MTFNKKTGEAQLKDISGQLKKIENQSKSTSQKIASGLGTFGDDLSELGSNLTKMVTVPITGLGVATAKTAIDFVKLKESTMIVFDRMLKGKNASEKLYQSLLTVAKASTYSQETFLNCGKSLVGMGLDANTTVKYLQAITDSVSAFGGSAQDIEELSTVFGKMAMKGKVDLESIWSLTDKGVNALKILANHYKVTTNEMQDMISDGEIPAAKALDVLTDAMQNGINGINGYVQGTKGMASQLKGGTLTGALDSLKSSFRNMSVEMWDAFENKDEMINAVNAIGSAMGQLPSIMGPVTNAIGPMLQGFADKLNSLGEMAKEHPKLFENIVQAILKIATVAPSIVVVGKGFRGLGDTIDALTKKHEIMGKSFSFGGLILKGFSKTGQGLFSILKGGIGTLKSVITMVKLLGITFNSAFGIAGIVVLVVGAIIGGLVLLYNKCEWFRNFVNGFVSGIVNIFKIIVDFFKNNWQTILLFILNPFAGIFKILYDKFSGFRNVVDTVVQSIVGFFVGLGNLVKNVILTIVNILAIPFDYLKNAVILVVAIVAMMIEGIYNIVLGIVMFIYNNVLLPIYNFIVSIGTTIYNFISFIINSIINIVVTVVTFIYNNVLLPIYNFIVSVATIIYNTIANFISMVITIFSTIASWIYNNVLSPIFRFFSSIFNKIWSIVSGVVNKIKNAFSVVASTVKNVFENVKKFIGNIFSAVAGVIKAPINGVIGIINKVLKAMNKIKVPDWVPGLGGKGVNFKMIPKLSVGTNYVQHEGLAYLHQGEAVVPKKYNPAIGGYGAGTPIVYNEIHVDLDTNKFGKTFINNIKSFSGGAKNSYNYGGGH